MKNKKIIVFVALLILATLVFVFKNKLLGMGVSGDLYLTDSATSSDQHKYLLTKGSRGDKVKLIQAYMNEFYQAGLIVDGIWGGHTQTAFLNLVKRVNFISSNQGITAQEFKYFQPHYDFLSAKYFNQK